MEQRLSSVDETLFQNPMMIPQTTEVPRPKLMNSDVKNGNRNAEERDQVFNEMGLVQDVLHRYISGSADGFTEKNKSPISPMCLSFIKYYVTIILNFFLRAQN